ncbi:MAG: hypothetical protein JWO71_2651 [Candidatus Acidoferrum typicum]|nr:hypothetical protein [Candidatus Acidoferrum typicum]
MNNIARQATKAEWKARTEIEQGSNESAHGAQNQKGPPEFAEWVHKASLKLLSFEVKALRRNSKRANKT